jgi:hypothetical protein
LQNNPLHDFILPTILTYLAPKDLNFPELQKDPFAFALKFLNTQTKDETHKLVLEFGVF